MVAGSTTLARHLIDPIEAIRLYEEGRRWREVGRILAAACGRRTPFQSFSVQRAVRNFDRGEPRSLGLRSTSHPR
jgi:hypothetical protein